MTRVERRNQTTVNNSKRLELLHSIKVLESQYKEECDKISIEYEEEGYPSHGSNYELRCESIWTHYEERINELANML